EVRRHMEYENNTVFVYVRSLLNGTPDKAYNITVFASGHHSIHNKLQELKELIVRYLPQRNNNLLNTTLFSIINCEQDLVNHCKVEDEIFVPVVAHYETVVVENAEKVPEIVAEDSPTDELSAREREIVACVARGLSNKQIAEKLCLSVHTVTTHRRNIAQKLEIHSAAGLAIYAVINGLVKIDELKD
ncbi:MAG: LuxR C-terminal-related transcriptional regulator, partial [Muribaculaceae bacterium]|nr:LuxR C-terminal-related transcriptional regulator [Muribaculaceae bacterium]